LLKENLAVQLREAILAGRILPGEKIIEGRWARQFGMAQVSIREALNILTIESLVTKGRDRSARVLKLGDPKLIQIYQLCGALEGLAARLVVEQKLILDDLEAALAKMQDAVQQNDHRKGVDRVQQFLSFGHRVSWPHINGFDRSFVNRHQQPSAPSERIVCV
jgi:DNA-binding GntR family transcriptional regulator